MSAALADSRDIEPRAEAAAFVLALRGCGVSDLAVLRAMELVPRELFAPRRYADLARQDIALPLACGETMTAPTIVAQMLAGLSVRPGHRVLEVGTGSGYVTALLGRLGAQVRSVERHPVLAESARHRLRSGGFAGQCEVECRDGLAALPGEARYDRIILNGAVPGLTPALTSRLAVGGRLVCGQRGDAGAPRLISVQRGADGQLSARPGGPLRLSNLALPSTES